MTEPQTLSFDELLRRCPLPRLEARALMQAASRRGPEWLIAHGNEVANSACARAFEALCEWRVQGVPIAYLVGAREFYGRRFMVSPAVLIPRPETELLIDQARKLAPPNGRIIDLGTGSGCIAVTLAIERQDLQVLATDLSAQALEIARQNAEALAQAALASGRLALLQSDWWQSVDPCDRFDLIISNPPYIAWGDPHLDQGDLRFEPSAALTDRGDGLIAIRTLMSAAAARLRAGGVLLVEHGFDQQTAVLALAQQAGFSKVLTHYDANHLPRVLQAGLA